MFPKRLNRIILVEVNFIVWPRSPPQIIIACFLTVDFLGFLNEVSLALIDDKLKAADLVFLASVGSVLAAIISPVIRNHNVEGVPNNIHFHETI